MHGEAHLHFILLLAGKEWREKLSGSDEASPDKLLRSWAMHGQAHGGIFGLENQLYY
jgi:hypothetical protein